MKNLMSISWLQDLVAIIVVGYLKFCFATTRWIKINQDPVEAVWDAQGPVVLALWHERLHLSHACWPLDRGQHVAVLASNSNSGDISVKINNRFAHHCIRGSSAKKSDPTKQKGGAEAFRGMLKWLRANNCVAMTPDGPRGPRREMTQGTLKLSQMSGASIVLIGQSTSRYLELKTWDKMRLPLPFARGAMVWEVLRAASPDLNEDELETMRALIEVRLNALTDHADRLVERQG